MCFCSLYCLLNQSVAQNTVSCVIMYICTRLLCCFYTVYLHWSLHFCSRKICRVKILYYNPADTVKTWWVGWGGGVANKKFFAVVSIPYVFLTGNFFHEIYIFLYWTIKWNLHFLMCADGFRCLDVELNMLTFKFFCFIEIPFMFIKCSWRPFFSQRFWD
jgi:hypothetical protein